MQFSETSTQASGWAIGLVVTAALLVSAPVRAT